VITSPVFAGKTYGVYGLARSGLATEAALNASGAVVWAWDDKKTARWGEALPGQVSQSRFVDDGIGLSIQNPGGPAIQLAPDGAGGLRNLVDFAASAPEALTEMTALVVSPGVPLDGHPVVEKANAAGVPVIGDIELFAQARATLPPHKVVGITGTNGKSTTTALIHHILQSAGVPSLMGGNIGLPILSQPPLAPSDRSVGVYVLELSSYQLELTFSLDCEVGVFLNLTPDHLERHGTMQDYAAAKARLFAMQSPGQTAVIDGMAEREYHILDVAEDPIIVLLEDVVLGNQADWPALQGPHNRQNAAAAVAACAALGLTPAEIDAGLKSYPGLAHRMERIAEKHGVLWVNDSKATNPDSTAPALAAYPRTHWIAGGRAKLAADGGAGLEPLIPYLGNVLGAYLIGEAAPLFAGALRGHVPVTLSETLDRAVRDAAAAAQPGDTVLLSPACASFDQFRDFEHRGDVFREAVEALS
jgi:UDP-N-acetylmuramoylalanine--D-glutamate ligase